MSIDLSTFDGLIVFRPNSPLPTIMAQPKVTAAQLAALTVGPVETIPIRRSGRRCSMYINENGMLDDSLPNPAATRAARTIYPDQEMLVGTVVFGFGSCARLMLRPLSAWGHQSFNLTAYQDLVNSIPTLDAVLARTVFEEFLRCLSMRQVRTFDDVAVYKELDQDRWSSTVFDFGHLLVPGHPEGLEREETRRLYDHGAASLLPIRDFILVLGLNTGQSIVLIRNAEYDSQDTLKCDIEVFASEDGSHWQHGTPLLKESNGAESWRRNLQGFVVNAVGLLRAYYASAEIVPILASEHTRKLNAKRQIKGLKPIQTVRTIHITEMRKVYERLEGAAHKGGTHASPHAHFRTITDRWVHPKPGKRQFRPYQRTPKVVEVNAHIPAPTEIIRVER